MGDATFHSTHWSIVRGGASADTQLRRVSLERLCNQYWFPLYAHLRRKGRDAHGAADLVQGFFTQLLTRDGLATVTEEGGRFRGWLLTSLENHERDQVAWDQALKRGGGRAPIPIDAEEGERRMEFAGAALDDPSRAFDRAWALSVLDQGLLLLEHELRRRGDARTFEVLGPLLSIGGDVRPREELARELGMKPVALRVALMRFRRRYQELLVQVVTDSVGSAEEAGQELELLSAALSGEPRDPV
ncbi:MAG: sigma-70 family RNA polymerase sigma factor [Planctomycetota bacterium]|jgi:RNA polymerase sigma-70 factor (ECF subfamily)